ncbi:MAG: flagellar protein FlaG [Desulfobacteraceae bacterium]|nr:flagellar protein FlaG [Desulfobacteraceae bacterium]
MEINSVSVLPQNINTGREQSGIKTDQISRQQNSQKQSGAHEATGAKEGQKQVAREEILDQIKGISEDGAYSVRFEKDDKLNELIVKVVDRQTDEVIRQIPPEELLGLKQHLRELRGNLADSVE